MNTNLTHRLNYSLCLIGTNTPKWPLGNVSLIAVENGSQYIKPINYLRSSFFARIDRCVWCVGPAHLSIFLLSDFCCIWSKRFIYVKLTFWCDIRWFFVQIIVSRISFLFLTPLILKGLDEFNTKLIYNHSKTLIKSCAKCICNVQLKIIN